MPRFSATMITDELVAKFAADMKKKKEDRIAFFESDVCKRMISDVMSKGDRQLNCDDIHYFAERTQEKFGWGDLTKEQMSKFCEVMSDGEAADAFIDCPDQENPFDHSYHLKGGLVVFMMHGQGTVSSIMAPETLPDIYEQLTDLLPRKITIEYRYVESDPWKPAFGHGCSNIKEAKAYTAQMGGSVFRWTAE